MSAVETTAPRSAPAPVWLRVVLGVIFGLLLAWDVWEALGNLLGVFGTASALGTAVSPIGWFVLLLQIALPLAAFIGVLGFGRRAGSTALVLAWATSTAVVAALSLDLLSIYGIGSLLV